VIGNGPAGFGRAASEKGPKGTSPTSYLGGLSSRCDRPPLDRWAGARRDARLASALRVAADVLRLVPYARASVRGRRARAPRGGRVAGGERRHAPVRYLERRAGGRRRREDEGAGVGGFLIWQGIDLPAETPGIDRKNRGSERW
jgi:hypothetical protein